MSRRTRRDAGARAFAPVFAALGDETRLALVARLADGARPSLSELTAGTQLTRQAVTKHLRVLEGARLVRRTRVGRESRFELDPAPMRAAAAYADRVAAQWDDTLARLKAFVER